MILDRLETLSALEFIIPAIPNKAETGKNCLFIRVDEGKLILTGGGEFVIKKDILIRPNTTTEAAGQEGNKTALPETFMIPRADIMAFREMMKEHKSDCKKLAKNDPSYLFIEINKIGDNGEMELISHEGKITCQQPRYEFKDLETNFYIAKEPITEIPMITADITAAMTGFQKSKPVEITFTGYKKPVHFQQGDREAIVLPPIEKNNDGDDEQIEIDE